MKNPLCLLSQRQYYSAVAYSMLAASATFDDPLLLPNPAKAPTTGSVVLVPVASPQAVQSIP